jgi:hypothetical protein
LKILDIEIDIYNYAGVSLETLARAEQETARVYRHAGIAAVWLNCPLTEQELAFNRACDRPGAPTRFILRFLSKAMARKFPLSGDIFGFAVTSLNGGFGVVANVFADRVQEMTADAELEKVILGHVIAHELGHLLLGEVAHTTGVGIMHVPWKTKELQQAKQGVLLFLPEQTARIREQVLARGININASEPRR